MHDILYFRTVREFLKGYDILKYAGVSMLPVGDSITQCTGKYTLPPGAHLLTYPVPNELFESMNPLRSWS